MIPPMKTSMKTPVCLLLLSSLLLFAPQSSRAGFFDQIASAVATNATSAVAPSASAPGSSLADSQVADGLKEALGRGVTSAVNSLGSTNGFLNNPDVCIPLPGKLQMVAKALRMAGQGGLVDNFVATMNHAAENSMPVAADVMGQAVQNMSISDAKNILAGPPDAATQYFKNTVQADLYNRIYPMVQKCTDQVGLMSCYNQMMSKYSALSSLGSLWGGGAANLLQPADLNAYVTNETLAGLYHVMAQEEASIRANPIARTSDLLKSVFGGAAPAHP